VLKKAQAAVQKTSRQNVMSTVLVFSSFLSLLMDVMGGKITINLKRTALKYKKKKHVHTGKRAGSALSRERTLELQQ